MRARSIGLGIGALAACLILALPLSYATATGVVTLSAPFSGAVSNATFHYTICGTSKFELRPLFQLKTGEFGLNASTKAGTGPCVVKSSGHVEVYGSAEAVIPIPTHAGATKVTADYRYALNGTQEINLSACRQASPPTLGDCGFWTSINVTEDVLVYDSTTGTWFSRALDPVRVFNQSYESMDCKAATCVPSGSAPQNFSAHGKAAYGIPITGGMVKGDRYQVVVSLNFDLLVISQLSAARDNGGSVFAALNLGTNGDGFFLNSITVA